MHFAVQHDHTATVIAFDDGWLLDSSAAWTVSKFSHLILLDGQREVNLTSNRIDVLDRDAHWCTQTEHPPLTTFEGL